jgi:hypothetical protein
MKMTFALIATKSTESLYLICQAQEVIRILLEELTCKNRQHIVEARTVIALTGSNPFEKRQTHFSIISSCLQ